MKDKKQNFIKTREGKKENEQMIKTIQNKLLGMSKYSSNHKNEWIQLTVKTIR